MQRNILYGPGGMRSPPLTYIDIDSTGRHLVCGTHDSKVILFNAKDGRPKQALKGHDSIISSVAFVEDKNAVLSCSWDGTARLWITGKHASNSATLSHSSAMKTMTLDASTGKGAIGCRDGLVKIFSVNTLKCLRNLQTHDTDISGLAIINDGSRLLTSSWDGECRLYDLSSFELLGTISHFKERIRCMSVTPDGSRAYLGLHSGRIVSLALDGSSPPDEYIRHTDVVSSLCFTSEGDYLISGSLDRRLIVWSVDTKEPVYIDKLETGITSVACDLKSRVYTTDFSGSLYSWEIPLE